jgi:phage/plasmid-like protein (TIGR03299 family)
MAHELEIKNGRKSFFSVTKSAWHDPDNAYVLTKAPTLQEAMELAQQNYTVVRQPTWRKLPDGSMVENDTACVVVRADTGVEIGAVSPGYEPIQNADAFGVLNPLIEAGVLRLETGGVLRDGADAWLLAQLSGSVLEDAAKAVFKKEVAPFVLLHTNHSGRRCASMRLTPICVVCSNTLNIAEYTADKGFLNEYEVRARHTKNGATDFVKAAAGMLERIKTDLEVAAQNASIMKERKLTAEEFDAIIVATSLGMHPTRDESFDPKAKLANMVVERYERRRDALTDLWDHGTGLTGDKSAWEAYNAVVEAVDHKPDIFPTRSGTFRGASLLTGQLGEVKRNVLADILDLADGQIAEPVVVERATLTTSAVK